MDKNDLKLLSAEKTKYELLKLKKYLQENKSEVRRVHEKLIDEDRFKEAYLLKQFVGNQYSGTPSKQNSSHR